MADRDEGSADATFRSRPRRPERFVAVRIDEHDPVHLPIREYKVRVPLGTPGAIRLDGRSWLLAQAVYAPGLPRDVLERAAHRIGLSRAVSWLVSQRSASP